MGPDIWPTDNTAYGNVWLCLGQSGMSDESDEEQAFLNLLIDEALDGGLVSDYLCIL